MKKLISLVLALVLLCTLIPMSAMATDYIRDEHGTWYEFVESETNPFGPKVEDQELLENLENSYKEYLGSLSASQAPVHADPNDHTLGWNSNTKYHWKECACGARFGEELHVDPLEAENDTCICGYHFSDNADLVTLWVKGCPPIKGFNKNQTEYKLNAYTYKDFKEIKISTRTHDSEATVELPEDLTLKEGENKFEIKVTSENKKVTKVYTVIVTKDAQK